MSPSSNKRSGEEPITPPSSNRAQRPTSPSPSLELDEDDDDGFDHQTPPYVFSEENMCLNDLPLILSLQSTSIFNVRFLPSHDTPSGPSRVLDLPLPPLLRVMDIYRLYAERIGDNPSLAYSAGTRTVRLSGKEIRKLFNLNYARGCVQEAWAFYRYVLERSKSSSILPSPALLRRMEISTAPVFLNNFEISIIDAGEFVAGKQIPLSIMEGYTYYHNYKQEERDEKGLPFFVAFNPANLAISHHCGLLPLTQPDVLLLPILLHDLGFNHKWNCLILCNDSLTSVLPFDIDHPQAQDALQRLMVLLRLKAWFPRGPLEKDHDGVVRRVRGTEKIVQGRRIRFLRGSQDGMGVMESALQEAARICDLYYLPLTAAETKDNWFDCVFHFDVVQDALELGVGGRDERRRMEQERRREDSPDL
ncbi:hypothetical protein BDY24DRAFT_405467 [Mrakia frigida]|uniref:uncharacterized protein n=1 Tax=Mrakia frigida TaxID=29902 RepID=UPI003FCC2051